MTFPRGTLAATLLAILAAACTAPSADDQAGPSGAPPTTAAAPEAPPASTTAAPTGANASQKAGALGGIDGAPIAVTPGPNDADHCSAALVAPAAHVLPLGSSLRVETQATCPPGKQESLVYRFELTGPNGGIPMPGFSPQSSADLDVSKLGDAGDYAIVVVTEPASFLDGDATADAATIAAATKRSQPISFTIAVPAWQTAWGACSSTCETGTQHPSFSCGGGGATFDDSWCTEPKPADEMRLCNTQACPEIGASLSIGDSGTFSARSGIQNVSDGQSTYVQLFADATDGDGKTWYVSVYVASVPTAAGQLVAGTAWSPTEGAYWLEASTSLGDTWQDWVSTPSAPPAQIQLGNDGRLHVVVDDPAVLSSDDRVSTTHVTIDLPLP